MSRQRKLLAIMFTDIVGFTEMSARDEVQALQLLERIHHKMKSAVEQYSGVWLKQVGDGSLSTFVSSIDALLCALQIQWWMQTEFEIKVRIGIHIGDVVTKDKDVLGDGVNTASRIQGVAEPGGICISEVVFNSLSSHPEFPFSYIGEKSLKGIAKPAVLYELQANTIASLQYDILEIHPPPKDPNRIKKTKIFGLAAAIGILSVGIYLLVPQGALKEHESTSLKFGMVPFSYQGIAEDVGELTAGASLDVYQKVADNTDIAYLEELAGHGIEQIDDASEKRNLDFTVHGELQETDGSYQFTLSALNIGTEKQSTLLVQTYELEELTLLPKDALLAFNSFFDIAPQAPKVEPKRQWNSKAQALYLQAKGKLQAGISMDSINAAEMLVDSVLTIAQEHQPSLALKCRLLLDKQQNSNDATNKWLEAAKPHCLKLLSLPTTNADIANALCRYYYLSGEYESALLFLNDAQSKNPDWHYLFSEIQFDMGNAQTAIDALLEYQSSSEIYRWETDYRLANYYLLTGEIAKAIIRYNKVLDINPNNINALSNLAACYLELGELAKANNTYTKINTLEPTHYSLQNQGVSLYFMGEFQESLKYYNAALEKSPNDYLVLGNLADSLMQLPERKPEALDFYSKALELASQQIKVGQQGDPQLYIDLGHYHSQIGQFDKADIFFELASQHDANNPDLYYYYAISLSHRGSPDEAKQALDLALENYYPVELIKQTPQLKQFL